MRPRRSARPLAALVAVLLAAAALAAGAGGVVEITFWHGQNETAKATLDDLVARFNRTHPKIRVKASSGGVLADQMLQKVTAALAGGAYPDVAYIFGSDVPGLARSPKVADLTDEVKGPGWDWQGIYPPARDATTVDGRVRAVPALLDVMAVVYNRKLLTQPPPESWTWDDYRALARRLTDPAKGVFGTGWPAVGDEDTVWRWWPMVWQLGGDVATRDGRHAGFGGAPGLRAMQTVAGLVADKSIYVDTKPGSEQLYQVFNSGKMAMVPTGPWELPEIQDAKIDYGVAPLPTYGGPPVTISGPDTWMVFDNGDARRKAAVEFTKWLTQPAQDAEWDLKAGSMPLRPATLREPQWKAALKRTSGLQTFIDQLPDGRVRPALRAYPKLSEAVGQSLVAVLLGRADPAKALADARSAADRALQTGGP